MSVTYHPDVEVMAGVSWTIAGTLYDATGKLFDITNATLAWGLLDPNAVPVPLAASISKTDAVNGGIQINIDANATILAPGRYTDALQVTEGAGTDVFWIGQILVAANPMLV
jgi:hypothetical protein